MKSYSSYTDKDLVSKLRKGDHGAFTEIYHRYWDKLFYWAYKKLQDLVEAENQVQDVFTDLWQRKEKLEITGELNSYLSVALKYRILNVQSKAYRAVKFQQFAATQFPKEDLSTQEYLSFEELKDRLASLVAKLPQQVKIAYKLREEGLSQKKIANTMHISEHTVERHVSRALKSLRKDILQIFCLLLTLLP